MAAMKRSLDSEILDSDNIPAASAARSYRELAAIHRVLGDTNCLILALCRHPVPIRRVLDIGCANGAILERVTEAASRGSASICRLQWFAPPHASQS